MRAGEWAGSVAVACLLKDLNRAKSLLLVLLGLLLDLDLLGDFLLLGSLSEFLLELLEAVHGDLGSGGDAGGELKGASCEGDLASFTFPNAASRSLHLRLHKLCYTFPQAGHTYFALCCNENFLTIFRMEEPYRVPYLPVIPTFLVRFAIITKYIKLFI